MDSWVHVLLLGTLTLFSTHSCQTESTNGQSESNSKPDEIASYRFKQQLCSGLCACDQHLQHINCTKVGVNNLSNIAIPKSVVSIILDKNAIEVIPKNVFEKLVNLEFLALRNNNIKDIDKDISLCEDKKLYHFFIDFNQLSSIPEKLLMDCSELKTLQIRNNYLIVEDFAKLLHYMPRLETLDISSNHFQNVSFLPKQLLQLDNLKYLYLSNLEIRFLSEEFFSNLNASNIVELSLAENAIVKVSNKSFSNMISLRVLDLSYTNINVPNARDIFSGLQESTHLRELSLQYVFIYSDDDGVLKADMFENLHNISSLKILHMEGNYGGFHGTLHKNFFAHIHNLEQLYLDHNELQSIHPKTFYRLHKLKKLSLRKNFLSCLVDCQFLQTHSMFASLEYLDLSNNVIDNSAGSYVFFSSQFFPKLKHLSLRQNRLSKLSQVTFNKLKNLKFLDVSENPISVITTEAFGTLGRLRTLVIENCHYIEFLPPKVFSGLNSLVTLKLSGNGIKVISSDALQGAKALSHLDLSRNELGGGSTAAVLHKSQDFSSRTGSDFILTIAGHNLTTLDLSHNYLESIPAELLRDQPQLKYISLNHNRIIQLERDKLANLSQLTTLDLSYNDILTLEYNCFDGLHNLTSLNLEGNPFYCDCSLINSNGNWLGEKYERVLYNSDNTKCAGPTDLQGMKVVSFHIKHTHWNCNTEMQITLIFTFSLVGLFFAFFATVLFLKILKSKSTKSNLIPAIQSDERGCLAEGFQNTRSSIYKGRDRDSMLHGSDSQLTVTSIETIDNISHLSENCETISARNHTICTPSVKTNVNKSGGSYNHSKQKKQSSNSKKKKSSASGKSKDGCFFPLFENFKKKGKDFEKLENDGAVSFASSASAQNGFVSHSGTEPLMQNLQDTQSSI